MKRLLSLLLACVMLLAVGVLASCDKEDGGDAPTAYGYEGTKELAAQGAENAVPGTVTGDPKAVKIGVILIGDDAEGYSKAHIDGIKTAASKLGIGEEQIIWKTHVKEDDSVTTNANQLIADGCTYIISNSYGHQDYMLQLAKDNPTIHFIAMTGDKAASEKLPNYSNAFTKVFESRYVAGVVAGLKLKELIDGGKLTDKNYDGENVKIGYVGAFTFAEVISGYTSFYLGVKSVVSNVVMDVQFTDSWYNFDAEKAAAASLVDSGCVIISQHADSAGAPTAVEEAHNKGKEVYCVGYNVSMLDVAPNSALTSATNVWAAYYEYALTQAINGENVATNWAAGYKENAVKITDLGSACAAGTQAKVDEVIGKIKSGELHVFDVSTFTVGGKNITWAYATDTNGDFVYDTNNVVADGYYHESHTQSAPSFSIQIDGIRWINK